MAIESLSYFKNGNDRPQKRGESYKELPHRDIALNYLQAQTSDLECPINIGAIALTPFT
jgi:hypothetical protein